MIMANRGKPFKTIVEAGHPLLSNNLKKLDFLSLRK